jgi:hypothetical protein
LWNCDYSWFAFVIFMTWCMDKNEEQELREAAQEALDFEKELNDFPIDVK